MKQIDQRIIEQHIKHFHLFEKAKAFGTIETSRKNYYYAAVRAWRQENDSLYHQLAADLQKAIDDITDGKYKTHDFKF